MSSPAHETLLDVQDLAKEFGPVRAVSELSFQVRQGEIVGLLGPNGAGKTTAMRMLVGYLVPTAGRIELGGGDIFTRGPELKHDLGYLPENVPLYSEMTVREYLSMAASLKGLAGEDAERELARVRDLLGLPSMWQRPTGQLSRGYRQRVGLAQCLLSDPRLLILDEPTTGLDPNQISELRNLLRSWRRTKGILLSTHILAEALMLCDRILIISAGRLVADGTPQVLAGTGEGEVVTQITVRGPVEPGPVPESLALTAVREEPAVSGHPAAHEAPAVSGHPAAHAGPTVRKDLAGPPGGADHLWRLEGRLDGAGRRTLMKHLLDGGYEVLEWNSGLGALEQTFRRLTIEEGRDDRRA